MDGIINVIKPKGISSHDVVYKLRKKLGIKKVGHTGTLDPEASGVLPICLGKGTKVAGFLLEKEKGYVGKCRLGIATDTQDLQGKILYERPGSPTEEEIRQALQTFTPGYDQVPPMYSALKYKGRKLYEYAREGIEVPREPRFVRFEKLEIAGYDQEEREITLEIICSKGTYIRTLCHDLGNALGVGGAMSDLHRTKSGPFTLENAAHLEDLLKMERWEIEGLLLPIDFPLAHLPSFTVEGERNRRLAENGNKPELTEDQLKTLETLYEPDQLFRLYLDEKIIGIGKLDQKEREEPGGKMRFQKVF